MGASKISKKELKSLGIPVPNSPPRSKKLAQSARKGSEAAKKRRAKKLAKRRGKTTSVAPIVAPVVAAGDGGDDNDEDDADDDDDEVESEMEEEGDGAAVDFEMGEGGAPEAMAIEENDGSRSSCGLGVVVAGTKGATFAIVSQEALERGDHAQPQNTEEKLDDEVKDAMVVDHTGLGNTAPSYEYFLHGEEEEDENDNEDEGNEEDDYPRDFMSEGDDDEDQVAESADKAQPPTSLAKLNLPVSRWRQLERRSRENLPRFLFRYFSSASGGGYKGLNGKDGVRPLAFLQPEGKEPTTIYDIPRLRDMIEGHLARAPDITTEFSSWAADLSWILQTVHGQSPDCHIAIIDTTLLASHVRVYHTYDLSAAGLTRERYSYEYLIYGPITGPAYHCVRITDIPREDYEAVHPYYQVYPRDGRGNIDHAHPTGHLSAKVVAAAKNIATLFRRPDDERPDVIIAMTVACLCLPNRRAISVPLSDHSWELIQARLVDELKSLRLPATTSDVVGLVNPKTRTVSRLKLQKVISLLTTIEAKVKHLREIETTVDSEQDNQQSGTQLPEASNGSDPDALKEDDGAKGVNMDD